MSLTFHDNISECNCLKNCACPNGYECCSEKNNKSGAHVTLGYCCKSGSCNYKTGICRQPTIIENFYHSVKTSSGNSKNCMLIFLIIVYCIVLITMCCKK